MFEQILVAAIELTATSRFDSKKKRFVLLGIVRTSSTAELDVDTGNGCLSVPA